MLAAKLQEMEDKEIQKEVASDEDLQRRTRKQKHDEN